jgi:DNA-binding GntR family transcriptional regulator
MKMILSGKLKKEDRLVQEKLALRFNVSRRPFVHSDSYERIS